MNRLRNIGRLLMMLTCECIASCGSPSDPADPQSSANPASAPRSTRCRQNEIEDEATHECVSRCNPSGLLHAQSLAVDGLLRHYMLYVPPTYSCDGPAFPLLIDFHGTWSGEESDNGEELYALDGLLAEANTHGFIVARPRSLSGAEDGFNIYRWDQNPHDLEKNAAFTKKLVQHLRSLYKIDHARVYASGFSSGTGMVAQFFADDPQWFRGYGFVGGGYFQGEAPARVQLDSSNLPRMYGVTGYRDYLFQDQTRLLTLLDEHRYPRDYFFQRTNNNGHELYGWHYREMLQWIDQGMRPVSGPLAAGWTLEATSTDDDFTVLADDGKGGLLAAASQGGIYRRDPVTGFSLVTRIDVGGHAPSLSGICVLESGFGVAVGEQQVARTTDFGKTWLVVDGFPVFNPGYADPPFINAVGCGKNKIVGVGYWDAGHSTDGARSFKPTRALLPGGKYAAQSAAVRVSAAGTWIAAGYHNYIGRSSDGVTFQAASPPTQVNWYLGIAAAPMGHFWVVGETGTILASTDDGRTWYPQASPLHEDFYAVGFYDTQRGMVVGAHGAAALTLDGGLNWHDASTGLDASLSDLSWLDAHTVLVVGSHGVALTRHVP